MEIENQEINIKVMDITPQVVEMREILMFLLRYSNEDDTIPALVEEEQKESKFYIYVVKTKPTESDDSPQIIYGESISSCIHIINTYYGNPPSSQNKTRDMIFYDKTYADGKYIVREGNKFIAYEKITTVVPGTFYNGTTVQMDKIAEFTLRLSETQQIKFMKLVCSNQDVESQNSQVTFIFDITLDEFKKSSEKYSDGYYVLLEGEEFVLYKKDSTESKGWIYNSTEISYKKIDPSQIQEIQNFAIVNTGTCATDGLRVTTYQKDVPIIKEDIKLTLEQLSTNHHVCIINKYKEIMKVEPVDNEISENNLSQLTDTKSTEPIESTEPIDQTNETKTGEIGETGDQVDSLV